MTPLGLRVSMYHCNLCWDISIYSPILVFSNNNDNKQIYYVLPLGLFGI